MLQMTDLTSHNIFPTLNAPSIKSSAQWLDYNTNIKKNVRYVGCAVRTTLNQCSRQEQCIDMLVKYNMPSSAIPALLVLPTIQKAWGFPPSQMNLCTQILISQLLICCYAVHKCNSTFVHHVVPNCAQQ